MSWRVDEKPTGLDTRSSLRWNLVRARSPAASGSRDTIPQRECRLLEKRRRYGRLVSGRGRPQAGILHGRHADTDLDGSFGKQCLVVRHGKFVLVVLTVGKALLKCCAPGFCLLAIYPSSPSGMIWRRRFIRDLESSMLDEPRLLQVGRQGNCPTTN